MNNDSFKYVNGVVLSERDNFDSIDNSVISPLVESRSLEESDSSVCYWLTPNIAYTGWAIDFVDRINDSDIADIVTFDNKNCLKWHARAGSGEYDTKYMFKIDWKEDTRYRIKYNFYSLQGKVNLVVEYTDGTTSSSGVNVASNSWLSVNFLTSSSKTVKSIHSYWSGGINYIDLDSFMISEGTTSYEYSPYEGCIYGLDLYDTIEPMFLTDNYYINCGIISIFLALIVLIVNAPFLFIRKIRGN